MKQGRNGFGRNQSAERLRKPESAAQPGEVNPVQVASQIQSAEGERNLRRVGFGTLGCLRAEQGNEAAQVGSNVQVGRKVMRGERIFCRKSAQGPVGKTSGCIRKEKHEEGSVEPIEHVPAGLSIL
jgi:hypothetical protein